MKRLMVTFSDDDMRWLEEQSALRGLSVSALVRDALRGLRGSRAGLATPFDALLAETAGAWLHGDGQAWQDRLRAEW